MINFLNTDREIERYDEAELFAETAKPEMFPDIRSKFNIDTGRTDLLAPLPSGGFVTLASNAPDIMVEAPTMPGMGADAALPVEGPIARAAEQTALETEPATAEMRPSLAGRTEVVKEVTKGLINGAIVQPANFLKENFGLYDPLAVQFVDPETGEFDFKLHIMSREEKADLDAKMAAGELPYAMSLDDLVAPDKDASAVAGAAGGISQFLGAYLGIGKLFRVGSGFTGAMTQGAAADFLAFDGSDKAVTDMLLDMGWIEPNMITELLKKDPTDPDYVGRFQAAVEGAGLGAVIEKGLIPILGLAFRAIKDKDVPVDAARQAIQQGKLMMQGALLKAGQNAELRMAERGPAVDFLSSTMMSGVDPTIATDPLVAAAGRAVGDGKMSSKAQDAASKLSEEFGVDFNVSNHPTSYGNSTYVSGRIAGPDGTFVDVGFRLSDHSTGDARKATDDFLTIIDDGEVTAETLVAEVQSQVDKAQPKMQALSEQRQQTDAAQADALDRWSKLSGDERGEIALKFKEIKPGYANNVPWKNLTKQQKADFAAREGLYND